MRRSFLRCAVTVVVAAGALSCFDASTAPRAGHPVRLAFAPRFSGAAAAIYRSLSAFAIDVDNVHITIRSADETGEQLGEVLKDTTVAFPSTADEITVVIELSLSAEKQNVVALVEMRQGTVAYFRGIQSLVAHQGETTADPEPVSMTYVGPGAAAEFISVDPFQPTLSPTATLQFTARAYDGGERLVPDLPISWTSSDASVATISTTGLATSTGKIGTTTITAKGLNGISEQTTLSVLAASALTTVTGEGQSDLVGALLAVPFTVQAVAANQIPVIGVPITFSAVTAGGAVSPATGTTGVNGTASTTMRLGSAVGAYTFSAQVTGMPNVPAVSVTGSALVGAAANLTIVSGANQVDTVRALFREPLVVRVTDARGNAVAGQTVEWSVTSGLAGVSPPNGGPPQKSLSTTTGSDGTVQVMLTADSVAGSLRVSASLPQTNVAPVLFAASANPGAPLQLVVIQQPAPAVQATLKLARQPQIQVADQFGNSVRQSGIEVLADWTCRCERTAHPLPTGRRSSALRSVPSGRLDSRMSVPTSISRAVITRDTITRGVVGTTHVLTDASGIATFTDLALNLTAGVWQLYFIDPHESLNSATSDDIAVSAGPAMSIVATSFDTIHVGTAGDSVRPAVQVIDAVGNGIAGVTINWDNKGGTQGRLDSTTTRTDVLGYATPGRWFVPPAVPQTTFAIVAAPVGLNLENAPLSIYATIDQQIGLGVERVPVPETRLASARSLDGMTQPRAAWRVARE